MVEIPGTKEGRVVVSWESWSSAQASKVAYARGVFRMRVEGARCSKCGYIGYGCICQMKVDDYA